MALVTVSSKCFNAVEAALEAVKAGDAGNSAIILQSIKQDGLLLQREASALCDRLNRAEVQHQRQVEDVTRQMNKLYEEERGLEKKRQALETKKSALTAERKHHRQSRQEAERRYQDTRKKECDAQRKLNEFQSLFWVPVVGQVLLARELIEDNASRASVANQEKTSHERDMNKAERGIRQANSDIRQATTKMSDISIKVKSLKRQQETRHKELGDVKSMTSFVMQAVAFWEEMNQLTQTATHRTDHLQRIVRLAAKRNTVRILRSEGTLTMMRSFRECWMEVAKLICSEDNKMALNGKGKYASYSSPLPYMGRPLSISGSSSCSGWAASTSRTSGKPSMRTLPSGK